MVVIFDFIKEYQVIISSTIAIGSAYYIIHGNRKTAAMTNAINIVKDINQDEKMQKGLAVVREWHNQNNKAIDCLFNKDCSEDEKEDAKNIYYVLNQYEHLAVGINKGIYSEEIIKECSYGTITNLVTTTTPLIEKARAVRQRNTIWMEIEILAKKWEQDPLKPKKK